MLRTSIPEAGASRRWQRLHLSKPSTNDITICLRLVHSIHDSKYVYFISFIARQASPDDDGHAMLPHIVTRALAVVYVNHNRIFP